VLSGEERREVMGALRRLPDRQREVLVLRFYLDLSDAEISRDMGIRPGTVRSTASRALTALGRSLGGSHEPDRGPAPGGHQRHSRGDPPGQHPAAVSAGARGRRAGAAARGRAARRPLAGLAAACPAGGSGCRHCRRYCLSGRRAGSPGGRTAAADRPGKAGRVSHVTAGGGQRSRLDAQVLNYFFPATGAEYSTGARLRGTIGALEGAAASSCMAQSGFYYPRASAAVWAAQFFDNAQFPDLARIARTGTLAPAGAVGRSARTPGNERRAFNAAFRRCNNAAAKPFTPLLNADSKLQSAWLAIVTRVQSSAKVRATLPGLRSCAERYAWPANPYGPPASSIGSFGDFVDWVAGHIDGAGSRGAGQARLRTANRHWAHIFVACARPTIAAQQRLQSARRAVFIQRHGRQHTRAGGTSPAGNGDRRAIRRRDRTVTVPAAPTARHLARDRPRRQPGSAAGVSDT
jgi:Sigma-70, region 4